jgi:hypothetical protein
MRGGGEFRRSKELVAIGDSRDNSADDAAEPGGPWLRAQVGIVPRREDGHGDDAAATDRLVRRCAGEDSP